MRVKDCKSVSCEHLERRVWKQVHTPAAYHDVGFCHAYAYCKDQKCRVSEVCRCDVYPAKRKADCDNCKHKMCWEYADPCSSCTNMGGEPTNWEPQTNADRIRAMTDEELADFIGGIFTVERDVYGHYDPRTVVMQEPRVEVRDRNDMLDWLKQEAET